MEDEHTPQGEAVADTVAAMIDGAEQRAEAAEEAAQAITDAAVQTEIVRRVEERMGAYETWQGSAESRLVEIQSYQELLLGRMTELAAGMALLSPPAPPPEPPPPEPPLPPLPASSAPASPTPPEPQTQNPSDAAAPDPAPVAPADKPAKRSKPKRRFW